MIDLKKNKYKIDHNTVVNLPTEKEAMKVASILEKLNPELYEDIVKTTKAQWSKHRTNTCCYVHDAMFGNIDSCLRRNKTVISAETFIKLHDNQYDPRHEALREVQRTLSNAIAQLSEINYRYNLDDPNNTLIVNTMIDDISSVVSSSPIYKDC